jgi:hypothetical protein
MRGIIGILSHMEKTTMKIAVVTTFNEEGLKRYGQRMIDTFIQNWPKEITLHIYPEMCNPRVPDHSRVTLKRLEEVPELMAFKNRWRDVSKANGDVTDDPVRSKRKDAGKGFKWHAVRFAHKVYAIFDCVKETDADVLFWMDADTVCHSPITLETVMKFCPANMDLGYLGREGKYTECGLYSMNLRSVRTLGFLREFQRMYDEAENGIFLLDEWHDSFVFDAVKDKTHPLRLNNWSAGIVKGEGHPLINSEWGAYLDHLKGDRKVTGRSLSKDLKVKRTESYWQ